MRILSRYRDYDMIYLTAIGQPPGGSSTVHIYTQTIQRMTQNKQYIQQNKNQEECRPCPVFAGFTLAFALQLRKKHGKTSVRVVIHKHTVAIYKHMFKSLSQLKLDQVPVSVLCLVIRSGYRLKNLTNISFPIATGL